jgi:hypothetical protein
VWAMFWWSVRQLYPRPEQRRTVWGSYRVWLYRLSGVGAYDPGLLLTTMDDFICEWVRFRDGTRPKDVWEFERRTRDACC